MSRLLTVAYIGFSVRKYHIPYKEDIARFTSASFATKCSEVSLVVVSAPDKFHVPYAKQILQAGKHVLVEKPLACLASPTKYVMMFEAFTIQ